jgi:plastocyanin
MGRWAVFWLAAAVTAVAALALPACGGDDDDAGGDAGGSGGGTVPDDVVAIDDDPAEVDALDNSFDAPAIRVPTGTTVRWTNAGQQDHDVVPAGGDGWGVEADGFHPGDVYEHTFDEPGAYGYYCTIHGTADRGMIGVVVVE